MGVLDAAISLSIQALMCATYYGTAAKTKYADAAVSTTVLRASYRMLAGVPSLMAKQLVTKTLAEYQHWPAAVVVTLVFFSRLRWKLCDAAEVARS
jgi:putative Mn2+ efflux pump MntP